MANKAVLTREELTRTYDYNIIRTLTGIKIRMQGEGLTSLTTTKAGPREDHGMEDFSKVEHSESVYSGTPYIMITERFER